MIGQNMLRLTSTCMPYIPTSKQAADVLTKGLPKKQFESLIGKMTMEDIFKPAQGGVLESFCVRIEL